MVAPTRADDPNSAIEAGRSALARGAWAEARVHFADALAQEETPEAFEGAGLAARYELDARAAIEAHVYLKIGASGRTARAVATAWAHARGIA